MSSSVSRDLRGGRADRAAFAALTLAALGLACSASSTSSSSLPPPAPLPSPPYYVTVSAAGVTPQVTHVWRGRAVIFRNQGTRPHSFFGDEHPSHLRCSGVLNLGALQPGESLEVRDLPVDACFFHGEEDPANRAFWGAVVGH